MSSITVKKLRDALGLGLGTFSRIWEKEAKDWVTNVFAADVDDDGELEVVACSRDGRVSLLTAEGDVLWDLVIGSKSWVGTVVARASSPERKGTSGSIIAGTRDGKVYVLDKDGQTINHDGYAIPFDEKSSAVDSIQEQKSPRNNTEYVIRQIALDAVQASTVIVGSDDRCAYGIDYQTGKLLWKFSTEGGVRTVRSYMSTSGEHGQSRIVIGSIDGYVYLLDEYGHLLDKYHVNHPIHTTFAADIDKDGCVEILVASDDKCLIALVYHETSEEGEPGGEGDQRSVKGYFTEKWRRPFHHRLISLCVTDIDNDGNMEIIASSEDKHIYILDTKGTIIWRHNHRYRVFSIYPCDLDGDGLPELLIGTEHNRIRAMRVRLYKGVEQRIRRYYHSLGETDLAGIAELTTNERALLQDIIQTDEKPLMTLQQALAQQTSREMLSALLVLKQQKVEHLWYKGPIGHIRTMSLKHTAGDVKREIIVGTSDAIRAFNTNGEQTWSMAVDHQIIDMQTGFIHQQKQEDIVICSSEHSLYMLAGAKKQKRYETPIDDPFISSICVAASNLQHAPEIIIGSEDKKIFIYGSDLRKPVRTFSLPEGIKMVRTHAPTKEQMPEIVAASLGKRIYTYTRSGQKLWEYSAQDPIRSLCIKDINGDGKVEVLVGSEDRNIHVLDHTGYLLWRYYLPHSALTINAVDADHDGKVEIFVGCADGYLYVFDEGGELLWTYQAKDRIHAVQIEDIDNDGNIEIVIGSEDGLELLRLVNQPQMDVLIKECWLSLRQQHTDRQTIKDLLESNDPALQVFALNKLADLHNCTARDFDQLEKFAKESSLEVRKALTAVIMRLYPVSVIRARTLLALLWSDSEPDVKNALIEHIHLLVEHDWELGINYLKRAFESENADRFIRRMVVRKLHQLIDISIERQTAHRQEIFRLLLTAAQDKASAWIRQEAAHMLAHFLSCYHESVIVYIHLFIVKGVDVSVFQYIAHDSSNSLVKEFVSAVIPMIHGLDERNVTQRLQQVVKALKGLTDAADFMYGKALYLIYTELYHLFTIATIEEVATYQCVLRGGQFDLDNKFALILVDIFNRLSQISRPLKMYFGRENIQDRLTSLLETIEAIDRVSVYLEQKYATLLLNEPITRLPDRQIFALLLDKWRKLVLTQLSELRGKAELQVELRTKNVRYEDQIGIWLAVKNVGRSSANEVKVTLLHDDTFDIVGNNTFETEILLPQEETTFEFILRPHSSVLNLNFEIIYNDFDTATIVQKHEEYLHLWESSQEYQHISNFYSSGVPTHNSKLFYGREKDITFLKDNLTQSKSVIVLYGQRRSGKTTLLVQLYNSSALGDAIPVFIDLQGMSYAMTAIDTFLHHLAYEIVKAMKKQNICVSMPELASFAADPTFTFNLFLDEIEEKLAGHKLILLIDEFEVLEEQVAKKNLRSEIFEYLREIVQHRQAINFLFSGTHKITKHTKWYRSVFFQIARHYQLSRLSPQAAEDLIQKPVTGFLEYEPSTMTKIHNLTADQPYLIHLLCWAIVEYCNDRQKTFVTINDVNIVVREIMQTAVSHFGWLWDQIKPEERVALAAVAAGGREDGRWLSFSEIEEIYRYHSISFKREYILDALKTLIDADIIENTAGDTRKTSFESNRFRIAVGLTRTWLLKEHPIELVRKEMSD